MKAWSSIVAKFHDHFTPSGRRASQPERAERKRLRRARNKMDAQRDLYGQSRQRDL
jgi:hypothetical protein